MLQTASDFDANGAHLYPRVYTFNDNSSLRILDTPVFT